jgi:membrane protease YdiL (CAAX protease family)
MKKVGEVRLFLSFFVVAVLVVAVDAMLMPILVRFYLQAGTALVLIYDFSVTLMAGWAGMFLARHVGLPVWWRSSNDSPVLRQKIYIIVLLSLFVVICNMVLNLVYYVAYHDQALQVSPWLVSLTSETALALSFRAALNEEVFFRLFLFPLILLVMRYFTHSQKASLVIAGLASAMLVGLIHPGFVQAFLIGLALVYIYYQRGLLPAIVVHFFADAVPLVLISLML